MMHKITTDGQRYLLRVELMSYEEEFIYAEYSNFWIGPECDNYRLHITGYLPNSTAGKKLHRYIYIWGIYTFEGIIRTR